MSFVQRTVAPDSKNRYYLTPAGGGYNLCIKVTGNSALPNCTGYAYGRFMEEAGLISCKLSRGNAEDWYGNQDGYPRGKTPKLGAVMCWRKGNTGNSKDGYGHVAIVERINPDGSVECSMSNYPLEGLKLPAWERKTYYPPYDTSTGLIFQGFIYNPALDITPLKRGMNTAKCGTVEVSIYKVAEGLKIGLLKAKNGLQNLRQIDMDGIYVYEKSQNNYFQMDPKASDPVGTVYGPRKYLTGEEHQPENYKDLLYYAIKQNGETEYGDWSGYLDFSSYQTVISPGCIFYFDDSGKQKIKYAPMVGNSVYDIANYLSYIAKTKSGEFLKGVTKQKITPRQLFAFLSSNYDVKECAFMDGGSVNAGSANQCYWNGYEMVDYQNSGRAVGDILAVYSDAPSSQIEEKPEETSTASAEENQPAPAEENTPETTAKPEEKPAAEQPTNLINFEVGRDKENMEDKDAKTLRDRAISLTSVASIITLTLTGVYAYMTLNQLPVPTEFMHLYLVCFSFYFGTKAVEKK